jgi:hypothetical protein
MLQLHGWVEILLNPLATLVVAKYLKLRADIIQTTFELVEKALCRRFR